MQPQIRTYFQIEARELIDTLTGGASRLHGGVPDEKTVRDLQRAAHTLKGAAHVVGERAIARLAHDFEDHLEAYGQRPSTETAGTLLALADELAGCLRELEHPAEEAVERTKPSAVAADPLAESARTVQSRTVRVELGQTQQMMHLAGEGNRLAAAMRRHLQAESAAETNGRALRETLEHQLDQLERQLAELFRVGSQLRLISTEALLLEAGRMVRATAASLDRQVACVTRGGVERIDVHVLEGLESALLHLIRNAVAHGIEPAHERRAQGKAPEATIRIELMRNGNAFCLTCADDGRGIDLEPMRAAAVASGALTAERARGASLEELLPLLFQPGFTTAAGSADQVSGRGIGLDAVRTTVASLGGTVRVATERGRGTTFTLVVPGTLFGLPVLEVQAGGRAFALPFSAVEQTFLSDRHHTSVTSGVRTGTTLLLEDETMPLVRLSDLVPDLPAAGAEARLCVVVRSVAPRETRRVAIAVESFLGMSDLLVRPLPSWTGALPLVAGAALGPSGEPRIVLDPDALVDAAMLDAVSGGVRRRPGAPSEPPRPNAPILVIDDSLTTRVLEQSILEAEGYAVEVATSAEQALTMARRKHYALFLVDVEMPGMNGFEFVRTVRADPELRRTPSIMVTSLDSAESRDRGRGAGAESYIVKGEFDQKVYLDRIRAVVRSGREQAEAAQ